jgi:hypothetical protein
MKEKKLRRLGRLFLACSGAAAFAVAAVAAQPGAAAQGAVLHSATGSAETTANGVPHGRTLSFSAIQFADGRIEGHARVVNRSNGFKISIDITCLKVTENVVLPDGTSGNYAQVAGVVTQGDLAGEMRSFDMLDTGEGSGAGPDLINVFTFGVDPDTSCEDAYPPQGFLVPVEAGDVQVR